MRGKIGSNSTESIVSFFYNSIDLPPLGITDGQSSRTVWAPIFAEDLTFLEGASPPGFDIQISWSTVMRCLQSNKRELSSQEEKILGHHLNFFLKWDLNEDLMKIGTYLSMLAVSYLPPLEPNTLCSTRARNDSDNRAVVGFRCEPFLIWYNRHPYVSSGAMEVPQCPGMCSSC